MSRLKSIFYLFVALVSGCGLRPTPTPSPPKSLPAQTVGSSLAADSITPPSPLPKPPTLAELVPPDSGVMKSSGITNQGEFICRQQHLLHPSPVTSNRTPADGYEVHTDLTYASAPGTPTAVRINGPFEVLRLRWTHQPEPPVPIPKPSQALLKKIAPTLFPQPASQPPMPPQGTLIQTTCRDERLSVEMPTGVDHAFISPGIHRFTATGAASYTIKLLDAHGVVEEWHLGGEGDTPVASPHVSDICPGGMQALDLEVLCAADFAVITTMQWRPIAADWCEGMRRRPCPDRTQGSFPCLFEPPFESYPEKGLCEFTELKRTRFQFSTGKREPIEISLPFMNLGTM